MKRCIEYTGLEWEDKEEMDCGRIEICGEVVLSDNTPRVETF